MLDVMHDCFGRQRHKDHREDMTGVGAYDDPCRTLYVGGLKRVPGYDIDKAVYIIVTLFNCFFLIICNSYGNNSVNLVN